MAKEIEYKVANWQSKTNCPYGMTIKTMPARADRALRELTKRENDQIVRVGSWVCLLCLNFISSDRKKLVVCGCEDCNKR